jgi:hypothetical protein
MAIWNQIAGYTGYCSRVAALLHVHQPLDDPRFELSGLTSQMEYRVARDSYESWAVMSMDRQIIDLIQKSDEGWTLKEMQFSVV